VALIGVVMLIPAVSAAAIDLGTSLIWGGIGIIVRVMIVWYLYQEPVKRAFAKN
jgi:multidrug transporter EmrE-like cation transporter